MVLEEENVCAPPYIFEEPFRFTVQDYIWQHFGLGFAQDIDTTNSCNWHA